MHQTRDRFRSHLDAKQGNAAPCKVRSAAEACPLQAAGLTVKLLGSVHGHCAGDDEEALDDIECAELDLGEDSISRSEISGNNAKFWEGLLQERHEQLLKDEEQQVREQWQPHHLHSVDHSPALDPAGMDPSSRAVQDMKI